VKRFIVNTHHLPECFTQAFPSADYCGVPIHFRQEAPDILETGGGIKNIEDLMEGEGPMLVYNGDILTDLPLEKLLSQHQRGGHLATLALRSKDGPLHISFDPLTSQVQDIRGQLQSSFAAQYLFTGVYIVEKAFLKKIPSKQKISVIPTFLDLIRSGEGLGGIILDSGLWRDLGNLDEYLRIHRELQDLSFPAYAASHTAWKAQLHPTATLGAATQLLGATYIGASACIGAGCRLENCIVWPGVSISEGTHAANRVAYADDTWA
jgi:NDP-sugar pyrophosphorylase family protein